MLLSRPHRLTWCGRDQKKSKRREEQQAHERVVEAGHFAGSWTASVWIKTSGHRLSPREAQSQRGTERQIMCGVSARRSRKHEPVSTGQVLKKRSPVRETGLLFQPDRNLSEGTDRLQRVKMSVLKRPGNARFALGRFADVCEKRRLETMRKLREWRSMKRRKRRRREEVNLKISGGQDRLCQQDSGTGGGRFGN